MEGLSGPASGQRGPPVIIIAPPPPPPAAGAAMQKAAGSIAAMATAVSILGVVQFITAFPCIALGVAGQIFQCENGHIMAAIWVGAMFLFAAVLGIGAGCSKEQCPLTCYHMLSIIGVLAATALTAIAVLSGLKELSTCVDATLTCPALCLTFNTLQSSIGLVYFFLSLASAVVSIILNGKIATSNEQVAPYPFSIGPDQIQASRSRAAMAMNVLQGPRTAETPNEDLRLKEVDYGDEGYKFM